MKPPDLVLIGLVVQALVLGHGAVQVFFEAQRPRLLYWLPLLLVVGYFVFAWLIRPPSLDRKTDVTPLLWLNAWRFVVQVAGFSVLVETLLYIVRQQRRALAVYAAAGISRQPEMQRRRKV